MLRVSPALIPPLDAGFVPAVLWHREFRRRCATASEPIALALERPDGTVSRLDTRILPHTGANSALNFVRSAVFARVVYACAMSLNGNRS